MNIFSYFLRWSTQRSSNVNGTSEMTDTEHNSMLKEAARKNEPFCLKLQRKL